RRRSPAASRAKRTPTNRRRPTFQRSRACAGSWLWTDLGHEPYRPAAPRAVVVDATQDQRAAVPDSLRRQVFIRQPQRSHDAVVELARRVVTARIGAERK